MGPSRRRGLDSERHDDIHPAPRRRDPMRKSSAASSPVGRRQFLTLSAAGLAAAGLPRAARAQGKRSGELVAGLSERMLTLDPANHYSISATSVHRHMFDPLVDVTNDSKFVPALAESWPAVNNLTWRFNLRKNVTFHDGTPFNADSVLYTLRRAKDNNKHHKSLVSPENHEGEKDGGPPRV